MDRLRPNYTSLDNMKYRCGKLNNLIKGEPVEM